MLLFVLVSLALLMVVEPVSRSESAIDGRTWRIREAGGYGVLASMKPTEKSQTSLYSSSASTIKCSILGRAVGNASVVHMQQHDTRESSQQIPVH